MRIIVPTFPGISTPSRIRMTASSAGRNSAMSCFGSRARANRPSGRSRSEIFSNVFAETVYSSFARAAIFSARLAASGVRMNSGQRMRLSTGVPNFSHMPKSQIPSAANNLCGLGLELEMIPLTCFIFGFCSPIA